MSIALSQFGTGVARGAINLLGSTILATASSTLASPTLDLNTDECYRIRGSFKLNAGASNNSLSVYLNADTTATNYDRQQINSQSTTLVGVNSNSGVFFGLGSSGDVVRFELSLWLDVEGHAVIEMQYSVRSTSAMYTLKETIVWRTTGVNVTGVTFLASTATSIAASGFMVVKRDSSKGVIPTSYYGPTFPPSPQTTDPPFYNTTLKGWYFWDGTRWLSETIHRLRFRWTPTAYSISIAATNADVLREGMPDLAGNSDVYLLKHHCDFFISSGGTALGASHKWVGDVHKYDSASVATTLVTVNVDSGSSNVQRNITTTINALLGTTFFLFGTTWTKTGTPGNLQSLEELTFRMVGT